MWWVGLKSLTAVMLPALVTATSLELSPRQVTVELPAPGGRVVHVSATTDGHHVLLLAPQPTLAFREAAGRIATRYDLDVEITELPWGGVEVLIGSRDPIDGVVLQTGDDKLRLRLDRNSDLLALRSRIRAQLRRSAPASFMSQRFRDAENALQRLEVNEAAIRFRKLTKEYELRSWAQLRLADVFVLRRNRAAACDQYGAVAEQFGERSAGVLARLRFQALHCPDRGRGGTDWRSIFLRVQYLDGPIGRFLFDEAQWTINRLYDADDIHFVLRQGRSVVVQRGRRRLLTGRMAAALIARVLYAEKEPMRRAVTYWRYAADIATHAEAKALLLASAKAFESIDLADQAVAVVSLLAGIRKADRSTLWNARRGDAQTKALRVSAVLAGGELELADELAAQYRAAYGHAAVASAATIVHSSELELARRVEDIDERMRRLRDVAGDRPASRRPSK